MSDAPAKLRLDKWLWHARFFKTRSQAAARVAAGAVRVNGDPVKKRATVVGPGDVLTFSQERSVRIVQIDAIGTRRGPAPEAQALYTDMSPPAAPRVPDRNANPSYDGKGRPTKKDRRALDRLDDP